MNTPATSTDPETYYKMPPVGMTETKARIGAVAISQFTVRCGSINCWYVGHAGNTVDAQSMLNGHECPTPPARNELPTGRSTLEKMWDELDDVTAALIEKREYNGMEGDTLKGYALGAAFALSMMVHPYFRTIKEISKELGARYRMSKGKIPWRATPSYRYNPMPEQLTANIVRTTPAVKQGPTRKAPTKRVAAPPVAQPRFNATADQVAAIKAGLASEMFTEADFAGMYGTTVEEIRRVAG